MKAIAYIYSCNNQKPLGYAFFEQENNNVKISIDLSDLNWGKHGCHIHTKGIYDTEGYVPDCSKLGGHLRLPGEVHGDINEKGKHIGDLGNLQANIFGKVNTTLYANRINLRPGNNRSVLDKFIIIHAYKDDLGKGGDLESLETGNSGPRIGYGFIKAIPH